MSRPIFYHSFQDEVDGIKRNAIDILIDRNSHAPISEKKKEKEINDILNASLNFTPVQIVEEKIVAALKHSLVPDHNEYYDLPDHEAKRTGSGENVSSITYTIPYTGNIADFDMGTTLQKAEFEGVIYDNVILLAFRFEGDVDTHAPLIKQKKDNFLRLVRENQQQLVSQLADIRQDMYVLLTAAADKIIEAKRQNLADAKKFL